MSARDEIAAAAETVDAIESATPYYRQTTRPGDAWVGLLGLDRDDTGFGYMERWALHIVLHQDVATAEAWIEAHVDDLLAALSEAMIVTAAIPSTLILDAQTAPGLVIEGTRPR